MIGIVSKDGGDTDQVAEGHEAEDEEQEEGEAGHGGGGVTGSSRQLLDTPGLVVVPPSNIHHNTVR